MCKSGLPQPWRAVKEHMIEGFLPLAGRIDQNGQILLHLILTDDVSQFLRSERIVDAIIRFGFGIERAATA